MFDSVQIFKKRFAEYKHHNSGADALRSSSKYDEDSWFDSQGEATEKYYDDFNNATKEEQENIKNLFDNLSKYKQAYASNSDEISNLIKQNLQDENDLLEQQENLWKNVQTRVQKYHDKLDDVQSAYDVLNKAVEENNEFGAISVDTLQSLLQLEPQYLRMLINENGELSLNEDAINQCTIAYIDNATAKTAVETIDLVTSLATEAEQLAILQGAADGATSSLWGLVDAKMAAAQIQLSADVFAGLEGYVENLKGLGEQAKTGVPIGGIGGFSKPEEPPKPKVDTGYYSLVDAQIEDDKKKLEDLGKKRDTYNRNLEHALEMGNKEEAEVWQKKIVENAAATKKLLHSQNNAYRATQETLMQQLYSVVPAGMLKEGLSWDELTEKDIAAIENYYSKALAVADDNSRDGIEINSNKFSGIIDNLRALGDAMEENSESWWDLSDTAKEAWESVIDIQDEGSRNWIEKEKAYGRMSEQEEIDALERMVANNRNYQSQILADETLTAEARHELWKKTQDIIEGLNQDIFGKKKDLR